MSTIAFLNIAMHGHINPTLPVVAELVRRGHSVTYHTSPAFSKEIEATGATVCLYPEADRPLADPPIPVTMLDGLARTAVDLLPGVLSELRDIRPDLIVHGAACLWGAVAARELEVPAASLFTTFANNRDAPSPTRASWNAAGCDGGPAPHHLGNYVRSRGGGCAAATTPADYPWLDLLNVRQPLNLVFTSREFQPGAGTFDESFQFVGPSLGARPADSSFPVRSPAGSGAVRLAGHGVQRRSAAAARLRHRARTAGRHRGHLHRSRPIRPRWSRCRTT